MIFANQSIFKAVKELDSSDHHQTYFVCLPNPPNTASDGLWGGQFNGRVPLRSSFPMFELQVLVIFSITQISHFFLKRVGFPLFISQMMAGLILGPSLQLEPFVRFKQTLFPYGSQDVLGTISSLGYALFIFLNGVQMDFSMIARTGRKAWAIALISSAAPLLIGYPSQIYFSDHLYKAIGTRSRDLQAVFVSHSTTSFAVIACLLNELKLINSELGRLALSSALVSDVLSTLVASILNTVVSNLEDKKMIPVSLVLLFAFVILIPSVCRPAMFWIIKHTPEGRPVKETYIYIIIAMVFGLGWVSHRFNQEFILGAFILGLAVPEGPPLGSALVKKLQLFGVWFLLPVFVTSCVMKADLSLDYTPISVVIICAFVLVTHLVKIIACVVTCLFCKMPMNDALSLALILSCKGVVELCLYSSLYDTQNISPQTYGVMVISIMVIASLVQMFVEVLYDPSRKYAGYQKRNIMSLKPNSELRMLVCMHKQCHISPIIDVLNLCCPTVDHPITVDALHLIELVGRSSPIFIPHRLQKTKSGAFNSYSDNVILSFNLYEHSNPGAGSVYTYTAISPPSLMHEDVCNLALDKLASIIILPFHRRWTIDGGVESDDKNIRNLNCTVLERAPCSVGILVTRANAHPDTSAVRLAMVFLGGKDDREALCLAKRATRDPRVKLVVYHLVLEDNMETSNLENMLDNAVLQDIRKASFGFDRVSYQQIVSNDGPQTSFNLRDIVKEHDLFIVGRRHEMESPQTSGLSNWSEFSELGTIGDLLASPDFESRASILVVQQQLSKNPSCSSTT